MRNPVYFFIVVLIPLFLGAQQIVTKTDINSIRIGEPIVYTLSIDSDEKQIVWPNWKQEIKPPIEILSSVIDSIGGRATLRITAYDSGSYEIPALAVKVGQRTLYGSLHRFKVSEVPLERASIEDLLPIKPIETDSYTFWEWIKKNAFYFLIPLFLLLSIGLIIKYWYRRKLKQRKEDPPHVWAFRKLDELDKKKLRHKAYYTELSYILKRYLSVRYAFNALESIRQDIDNQLKNKMVSKEVRQQIDLFLQNALLVKYAKMNPDEKTLSADRMKINQIIIQTQNIPEKTV